MKKILIMLVFILSFGLCSCQSAQEKAIEEFLDQNNVKYIEIYDYESMLYYRSPKIEERKKMIELLVYLNPIEASYIETIPYEEAKEIFPKAQRYTLYCESEEGEKKIIFDISENGRLWKTDEKYEEITYTEENHADYEKLQEYLRKEYPKNIK